MMKNNIKLSEIELNVRENGNFRFVSFFFCSTSKIGEKSICTCIYYIERRNSLKIIPTTSKTGRVNFTINIAPYCYVKFDNLIAKRRYSEYFYLTKKHRLQ